MPKVFISHAWEDNRASRKLAEYLRSDGAEIWIYYANIESNGRLPQVFKQAIEWCDEFILLWSKSAAHSDSVKLEWHRAFFLKKRIISCLLDDTRQSTALGHQLDINFNDFDRGYNYLAQLLNLKKIEAQEPKPGIKEDPCPVEPTFKISSFRADAKRLSEDEVEKIIKEYDFFDIKRHEAGKGTNNQFEVRESSGDRVVYDHITGLLWQQGGSLNAMWYEQAKKWLGELNQKKYAGFSDWRLPTLEEGMSLMERKKSQHEFFIDPIFEKKQSMIWTSDLTPNASLAWVIFFNYGTCYASCFDFSNYGRAVRRS